MMGTSLAELFNSPTTYFETLVVPVPSPPSMTMNLPCAGMTLSSSGCLCTRPRVCLKYKRKESAGPWGPALEITSLHSNRSRDERVGIVVLEHKIFVPKTEEILYLRIQNHSGQRTRRARQLKFYLLLVVEVDVDRAEGMNELPRLQSAHLCHHHRKQGIARNGNCAKQKPRGIDTSGVSHTPKPEGKGHENFDDCGHDPKQGDWKKRQNALEPRRSQERSAAFPPNYRQRADYYGVVHV